MVGRWHTITDLPDPVSGDYIDLIRLDNGSAHSADRRTADAFRDMPHWPHSRGPNGGDDIFSGEFGHVVQGDLML